MKKSNVTVSLFRVMFRARKLFGRQLTQNLDTKIACIVAIANEEYDDPQRIFYDIKSEARRLTNLMDFNKFCQDRNLIAENVAQHIVFEGNTVINKIMRYGVAEVVGERVRMFGEPLYNSTKIKGLLASGMETANPDSSGTESQQPERETE